MGRKSLWALAVMALALALASPLHAQEDRNTPTIFEGEVGPHWMVVQAIPNPPSQGFLNLHATLRDSATRQYVDDAEIRVYAQRHESSERGRALLLNSPASPNSYSTQLNILEEGVWTFTFEVSSRLGSGSAEVSIEVERQPRSIAGWLAWAGIALALLLLLGLAWRNARIAKAKRGRASN